MRVLGKYFRMPNKARKKAVSLQAFKKKVGCVLESMSQLSSAEQSEAYGFLQNCVSFLGSQTVATPSADSAQTSQSSSFENGSFPENEDCETSSDSKIERSVLDEEKVEKCSIGGQDTRSGHSDDASEGKQIVCSTSNETETISNPLRDSASDSSASPRKLANTRSELITCEECGVKLKSRRAMLAHLDRHSNSPVSCLTCRKAFNSVSALKFHYSDYCISKKLVCPQCKEVLSCRTHYGNHMEGHKRNNCQVCPSLFTNRKNLVMHMAEAHNVVMLADAAFVCNVEGCDRRFVKRSTLHRHMQIRHTRKGQQVCITCGLYVEGEEKYKAHVETHRQWTCEECSESFTRRQQFRVHMASHEESKYKCITCSQTLPTKARVLEHRKEGHEIEGLSADFPCEECDKKFFTTSELRDHGAIHKPPGAIVCKHCSKTFSSRKSRNYHIRKQHGGDTECSGSEASLICEHCGKQFRQPCFLAKHLKGVHNEQIFSCSFCDHKTNNEINMRRHRALHTTQEQQFVCDQCGASFQALSALKDHNLYVHSDERNFSCDVCKKSFKRKNDLTRHQRSHSDDRMYVCHCKQSYKFMAHLRRHQEAAHKTVPSSRKVQRLVPDADGKLVQKPKPVKEKRSDKEKKEMIAKLDISEAPEHANHIQEPLGHSLENPPEAMQLLTVKNEVVTLSVADLQIADQQVDPYSIQVSYDGLNFSDSKTQLVYTTSPPGSQVMSLQLPQFELVQPNLAFDTNTSSYINGPHGPMLMSIATSEQPTQPVMTLIAGLEQNNSLFSAQSDTGTMTEQNAVFSGNMIEHSHNSVEVKSVETFASAPVLDHKTNQTDMSTMTDMYSSVYGTEPPHHELITMSFPALDPSPNLLLAPDQNWSISQESVSLPQYSAC